MCVERMKRDDIQKKAAFSLLVGPLKQHKHNTHDKRVSRRKNAKGKREKKRIRIYETALTLTAVRKDCVGAAPPKSASTGKRKKTG